MTHENQSENMKSSNFFDARRIITALRKKDESRKSNDKKATKTSELFCDQSIISTVLN